MGRCSSIFKRLGRLHGASRLAADASLKFRMSASALSRLDRGVRFLRWRQFRREEAKSDFLQKLVVKAFIAYDKALARSEGGHVLTANGGLWKTLGWSSGSPSDKEIAEAIVKTLNVNEKSGGTAHRMPTLWCLLRCGSGCIRFLPPAPEWRRILPGPSRPIASAGNRRAGRSWKPRD